MSAIKKYPTASFRGVPFFFRSESAQNGRKTVSHEFPNSSRRYVEDLGELPTVYTMSVFVHGDKDSTGFAERDALKNALDEKGPGLLFHPVYGGISVIATEYSIYSDTSAIGIINFRLRFQVSNADFFAIPEPTRGSTAAGLNSQGDQIAEGCRVGVLGAALDTFEKAIDDSFFGQLKAIYEEGLQTLMDIATIIDDGVVKSLGLQGVNRLILDPPTFLTNPEVLFPQIASIYRTFSSTSTLDKWVEATRTFVGHLDSVSLSLIRGNSSVETRRSQLLNKSQTALMDSFTVNSLINSYQSANVTEFNTETELADAERNLDDLFQAIVNNPAENSIVTNINFPQVKTLLLELRNLSKIIFTEKQQYILKVVDFDPKNRSVFFTCYNLYASLDNLPAMSGLNKNVNNSNPPGLIKVLEQS